MQLHKSLRPSRALATVIAATAVLACSSESATGPSPTTRAAAVALLDSARAGASGNYPDVVLGMLQELVLGAQVGTIRLTVNGKSVAYPMVAAWSVQAVAGRAFDSLYVVSAWSSRADTIWVIEDHQGPVLGLVTKDTTIAASSGSLVGTVTPSAPFGACSSIQTPVPPDVTVPFGIDCQQQTVQATMSGRLIVPSGTLDVTVPSQRIAGIHLVANAP